MWVQPTSRPPCTAGVCPASPRACPGPGPSCCWSESAPEWRRLWSYPWSLTSGLTWWWWDDDDTEYCAAVSALAPPHSESTAPAQLAWNREIGGAFYLYVVLDREEHFVGNTDGQTDWRRDNISVVVSISEVSASIVSVKKKYLCLKMKGQMNRLMNRRKFRGTESCFYNTFLWLLVIEVSSDSFMTPPVVYLTRGCSHHNVLLVLLAGHWSCCCCSNCSWVYMLGVHYYLSHALYKCTTAVALLLQWCCDPNPPCPYTPLLL